MTAEFHPELYDDIPSGYYDRVYDAGRGIQWFWHQRRFAAVADWIPPSGDSILDMGCGAGTFLGHFASRYARAVGIDLARPQIEFARQKYGNGRMRFEAADVTALGDAGPFDVVVSIEVIEHLPPGGTQPFLRSILRMLKPGGIAVLTTPNYRSLWPVIEWIIGVKGPVDYRKQHINHFDPKRLAGELAEAGFVNRRMRTFFVVAPFLAAISTPLADRLYAVERRLLPRFGAEIAIAAEKPK